MRSAIGADGREQRPADSAAKGVRLFFFNY
jgi:hypothetical protein